MDIFQKCIALHQKAFINPWSQKDNFYDGRMRFLGFFSFTTTGIHYILKCITIENIKNSSHY